MDLSERTPAQTIDEAHEDLNNATTAPDEHRRQQYARSAQDALCEVSLDARSTREQKAAARENLVTAISMTGALSALARNIRPRQRAGSSPAVSNSTETKPHGCRAMQQPTDSR